MRSSNALSDTYSREHVTYCNWAAQKIESLAVLPFANVTADPNSEYRKKPGMIWASARW